MAASAVAKALVEITGLGEDSKMSVRATLSDVPTLIGGPIKQSLTTAAVQVDVASVVSGELVLLLVKALTSNVYCDPTGVSTLVSNYCYIPEGQFNLYTFETTNSCLPTIRGKVAGVGVAEYVFAAIS